MGCLLEKLMLERAFEVKNDYVIEPLLYIVLDATFHNPSADSVNIVKRLQVLCLLKILGHKYISSKFQ